MPKSPSLGWWTANTKDDINHQQKHFDCVFNSMNIIKSTGGRRLSQTYSRAQRDVFRVPRSILTQTTHQLLTFTPWSALMHFSPRIDGFDVKIPWTNVWATLIQWNRWEIYNKVAVDLHIFRSKTPTCSLCCSHGEVNRIAMCFVWPGQTNVAQFILISRSETTKPSESHKLHHKLRFLTEKHKFQCSRNQNTKQSRRRPSVRP